MPERQMPVQYGRKGTRCDLYQNGPCKYEIPICMHSVRRAMGFVNERSNLKRKPTTLTKRNEPRG